MLVRMTSWCKHCINSEHCIICALYLIFRVCYQFYGNWKVPPTRRCGYCFLGWTTVARPPYWNSWHLKTSLILRQHRWHGCRNFCIHISEESQLDLINMQSKLVVSFFVLGFQYQERPISRIQIKCVGYWWSTKDQALLEELLWEHRCIGEIIRPLNKSSHNPL